MKHLLSTIALLSVFSVCGAQTIALDSILNAEIAKELSATGRIQKIAYKDRKYELSLVPQTELARAATQVWAGKKRPVFVAETLYLIKKPTSVVAGADVQRVSEILRSFTEMKGMEYFSNTGQRMSVLYHDIYTVNNENDKTRILDQTGGSSDGKSIYVYQEMATFGTGIYEYDFRQSNVGVLCASQNLEPITYSIFKLVKPGNLRISFSVTDLGDAILVYSLAEAEFFAISSLEERLTGAFVSRTEAVYNWFEAKYLDIFSAEAAEQEGIK